MRVDASQVIWVATANDERAIPEPILNRVNVYEVQAPDREAARTSRAASTPASAPRTTGASRFEPEPTDEVLDRMAEMAPREMRRAWMTASATPGSTHRDQVAPRDLPEPHGKRSAIGFVQ